MLPPSASFHVTFQRDLVASHRCQYGGDGPPVAGAHGCRGVRAHVFLCVTQAVQGSSILCGQSVGCVLCSICAQRCQPLLPRVITLLVSCACRVVIAGGNNNPWESWITVAYTVIRDFSLPLSPPSAIFPTHSCYKSTPRTPSLFFRMAVYSYTLKLDEEALGTLEQIGVSLFFPRSRQAGGSWQWACLLRRPFPLWRSRRTLHSPQDHGAGVSTGSAVRSGKARLRGGRSSGCLLFPWLGVPKVEGLPACPLETWRFCGFGFTHCFSNLHTFVFDFLPLGE